MKILISVLLMAPLFFGQASKSPGIKASDLKQLTGKQWVGTLTYLDYSRNKKVSIPSNLKVTQSSKDKLSWIFEYQYPEEPKADSKKTVTISVDGSALDNEAVVERTKLADKMLKIVTEKKGQDDDRPALFRYTYMLGAKSVTIKKEVRLEGAGEFFVRNEYSWTR